MAEVDGTVRQARRWGGLSGGGVSPTRNRSSRTSTPRTRRRAHSSADSKEISWAHTLLGTRSRRVSPKIEIGRTRSAMRAPTASRHTAGATAICARQNRDSPARSRIAASGSGTASGSRARRGRTALAYHVRAKGLRCLTTWVDRVRRHPEARRGRRPPLADPRSPAEALRPVESGNMRIRVAAPWRRPRRRRRAPRA